MPASITSRSPVGRATIRPPSSTSSLRTISTPSTRSVAEDRDRRDEEAQADRPRLALGRPHRVLVQQLDVPARPLPVLLERPLARGVEHEVGGIDDHVGARELAELLQLGRREGRLHRAAAAEHARSPAAASRRSPGSPTSTVSVGCELLRRQREHARARRSRRCRCRRRRRARAPGRCRGPGSRGGRCTRRRTPWPATSRAGPRPGCPSAGRSARRRCRGRRRTARGARRA